MKKFLILIVLSLSFLANAQSIDQDKMNQDLKRAFDLTSRFTEIFNDDVLIAKQLEEQRNSANMNVPLTCSLIARKLKNSKEAISLNNQIRDIYKKNPVFKRNAADMDSNLHLLAYAKEEAEADSVAARNTICK